MAAAVGETTPTCPYLHCPVRLRCIPESTDVPTGGTRPAAADVGLLLLYSCSLDRFTSGAFGRGRRHHMVRFGGPGTVPPPPDPTVRHMHCVFAVFQLFSIVNFLLEFCTFFFFFIQ